MIESFLLLLVPILYALLSRMIGEEFGAACHDLARWLIRRNAGQLKDEAERYEEQWLADLDDRKTPLRRLLFAIGIFRAAAVLRRDSIPKNSSKSTKTKFRFVVQAKEVEHASLSEEQVKQLRGTFRDYSQHTIRFDGGDEVAEDASSLKGDTAQDDPAKVIRHNQP